MPFVWIFAAVLMLFNAVYCVVSIRRDVASERGSWAAVGIIGIIGVALAFGAIKISADNAFADMAVEALRDF